MARSVTVRAPDGRQWKVTRRWGRRPRFRRRLWEGNPEEAVLAGDLVEAALWLTLVVAVAVLVLLFLPLLVFVVEAAVLAAGAYALGMPWEVEAAVVEGAPAQRSTWRVRGWRRSRRAVAEVARELELGVPAEPEDTE